MKFKLKYLLIPALLLLGGCGKDSVEQVDNWAKKAPDYSAVLNFVERASFQNDYCKTLSATETKGVSVVTKSGASITIPAPCPLIKMDTQGSVYEGTVDLGVKLDVRSTWYQAPELSISRERRVTIGGTRTSLVSEGACVLDCGKYIYFYLGGQVMQLASECTGTFNPPLPKDKSLLKVLFVGNSFNVDATAHLPGMLAANGTKRVLMGRAYHGGCTLAQYDEGYSSPRFCSYRVCRPGDSDWDDDEEYDTNLEYIFSAEDWDVVTFMEYTGHTDCWEWSSEDEGHINSLINKLYAAHPEKRPTVMFMLTHTFASQSDLVMNSFGGNQMRMYETIVSYAQNLVNFTCIDDVIATGTAVQNLRTSKLNTDPKQDLSRDGFHLDYGVGRYTAACTVFYNIFEPALALSLEGNTYRYSEEINLPTNHSIPVTDDNVDLCRQAARYATDKPFTLTNM